MCPVGSYFCQTTETFYVLTSCVYYSQSQPHSNCRELEIISLVRHALPSYEQWGRRKSENVFFWVNDSCWKQWWALQRLMKGHIDLLFKTENVCALTGHFKLHAGSCGRGPPLLSCSAAHFWPPGTKAQNTRVQLFFKKNLSVALFHNDFSEFEGRLCRCACILSLVYISC